MFKRLTLVLVLVLSAAVAAATTSRDADSAAQGSSATRMQFGFYDDAQVLGNPTWAFNQLRLLRAGVVRTTLDWATIARRRPVKPTDPADPAYNWTAVDQRRRRGRQEGDPRGPRDLRHAALGRSRPEPGPAPRDRPPFLRERRREALQRHVHGQGAGERAGAHAAGRPKLARLERAEQPGLPPPAVEAGRAEVARPGRVRLREDLLGDLCRREVDPARRPEGRLRRHGPEGQRRTAQLAAVDVAARLHVLAPPRGREANGRLRAPSLLRPPHGEAGARSRARRRP